MVALAPFGTQQHRAQRDSLLAHFKNLMTSLEPSLLAWDPFQEREEALKRALGEVEAKWERRLAEPSSLMKENWCDCSHFVPPTFTRNLRSHCISVMPLSEQGALISAWNFSYNLSKKTTLTRKRKRETDTPLGSSQSQVPPTSPRSVTPNTSTHPVPQDPSEEAGQPPQQRQRTLANPPLPQPTQQEQQPQPRVTVPAPSTSSSVPSGSPPDGRIAQLEFLLRCAERDAENNRRDLEAQLQHHQAQLQQQAEQLAATKSELCELRGAYASLLQSTS